MGNLDQIHPAATGHLPGFITGPGQTDVLFVVTLVLLLAILLVTGNLYLRLHALPERMAHRTQKVQMEIVAVLALIALFTHNHLFWIAALLLAFVQLPDFSTPITSMARSLEKLARDDGSGGQEGAPQPALADATSGPQKVEPAAEATSPAERLHPKADR